MFLNIAVIPRPLLTFNYYKYVFYLSLPLPFVPTMVAAPERHTHRHTDLTTTEIHGEFKENLFPLGNCVPPAVGEPQSENHSSDEMLSTCSLIYDDMLESKERNVSLTPNFYVCFCYTWRLVSFLTQTEGNNMFNDTSSYRSRLTLAFNSTYSNVHRRNEERYLWKEAR